MERFVDRARELGRKLEQWVRGVGVCTVLNGAAASLTAMELASPPWSMLPGFHAWIVSLHQIARRGGRPV